MNHTAFPTPTSAFIDARVPRPKTFAIVSLAALVLGGCAEGMPRDAEFPRTTLSEGVTSTPGPVEPAAPADDSASIEAAPEVAIGVDTTAYADADPSALTEFQPVLQPYGTWAEDANFGVVWTPSPTVVGPDFAPYVSAGRWTYEGEYVWVSDYSWGWAPFHYGRWVYIAGRGWSWIPGRRYSGAWVVWRTGDAGYGFVGWAPAPPLWYWRGGYAVGLGVVPRAPYVFCPTRHVFDPGVHSRLVRGSEVAVIGAQTRPYVPAQPTVRPDTRVIAAPQVNGARLAEPRISNGPPPRAIGLAEANAPPPPTGHAGLERAREMAQPRAAFAAPVAIPPRPVFHATELPTRLPAAPRPIEPGPTRLPDIRTVQPPVRIEPPRFAPPVAIAPSIVQPPPVRVMPPPAVMRPSPPPIVFHPSPPMIEQTPRMPSFAPAPAPRMPSFAPAPAPRMPTFAQPMAPRPVAPAFQAAPMMRPPPAFAQPSPAVAPPTRFPGFSRRGH